MSMDLTYFILAQSIMKMGIYFVKLI